jgi:hypothetical protein
MIVAKRQSAILPPFIFAKLKMHDFWRDGMLNFIKGKHFISRTKARETYLPS